MSYIRTKDGRILDFDKLNEVSKLSVDMAEEPIREAETIEELCDEFIDIIPRENGKAYHDHWEWSVEEKRFNNDIGESVPFDYFSDNTYFRGAIWTDKGLIYVAKMNSDGKLVLI